MIKTYLFLFFLIGVLFPYFPKGTPYLFVIIYENIRVVGDYTIRIGPQDESMYWFRLVVTMIQTDPNSPIYKIIILNTVFLNRLIILIILFLLVINKINKYIPLDSVEKWKRRRRKRQSFIVLKSKDGGQKITKKKYFYKESVNYFLKEGIALRFGLPLRVAMDWASKTARVKSLHHYHCKAGIASRFGRPLRVAMEWASKTTRVKRLRHLHCFRLHYANLNSEFGIFRRKNQTLYHNSDNNMN